MNECKVWYLKTLELDELLHSIHNKHLVVVVDVADISGVQPSLDVESLRRGIDVVKIA